MLIAIASNASLRGRVGMLAWLIVIASGCAELPPLERLGVSLTPPSGWTPASDGTFLAPGRVAAAWQGTGPRSLVVFSTLPDPRPAAESLLAEWANRATGLTGWNVVERRVEAWDGQPAARVEVIGPGTGSSMAPASANEPRDPKGRQLIPTHRVLIGIPRGADTLFFLWHGPESEAASLLAEVEQFRKTVRIAGSTATVSTY